MPQAISVAENPGSLARLHQEIADQKRENESLRKSLAFFLPELDFDKESVLREIEGQPSLLD